MKSLSGMDAGKGVLIVFEGIDGSGKSTQAERSYARLAEMGLPVSLFREPTDGRYGAIIRQILSGAIPRKSPEEELALFIKDREEDVARSIKPALDRGDIVLLDRYYFSTMAYQGALGLDVEDIRKRNEAFAPKPDLLLIFLIPVEEGIGRIAAQRKNGLDSYEKEAFLRDVDGIFRSFKAPYIHFIDAERPIADVNMDVDRIIDNIV